MGLRLVVVWAIGMPLWDGEKECPCLFYNIERVLDRDFIRLLWHNELFDDLDLLFSDRRHYSVRRVGVPSSDDPYLFNGVELFDLNSARVVRGAVRIDEKSSHWHNAPLGKLENIMLHLVGDRDKRILTPLGEQLTAQIKPRGEMMRVRERMAIDCVGYFTALDPIHREAMMLQLVTTRLERKGRLVMDLYGKLKDWREVLYVTIMRSFGYKEKKDDFERLALSLPYKYIVRHAGRSHMVEAMLLGQAGYLEVAAPDQYTLQLQKEWLSARAENCFVEPILNWKSAQTRPQSLPAISIVRAAVIFVSQDNLVERVLTAKGVNELIALFDVALPIYWRYHSAPSRTLGNAWQGGDNLSADKLALILINAISPYLWAYGTVNGKGEFVDRAIELLDEIVGEKNTYTNRFASHSLPLPTAFDSQAIIELCSLYCTQAKCTACPIGAYRLRQTYRKR